MSRCNPDAAGQVTSAWRGKTGNGYSQCLCHAPCLVTPRVGQERDELLPAPAAEKIGLPQQVFAGPCHCHQRVIARRMAQFVVDDLEVIDVEDQQAKGPTIAFETANSRIAASMNARLFPTPVKGSVATARSRALRASARR